MSDYSTSYHHERIADELLTLLVEGRIFISYFMDKFEVSKRVIYRDIKLLRDLFYMKYEEDVSIMFNAQDNCYELFTIKGKIYTVDIPYSI